MKKVLILLFLSPATLFCALTEEEFIAQQPLRDWKEKSAYFFLYHTAYRSVSNNPLPEGTLPAEGAVRIANATKTCFFNAVFHCFCRTVGKKLIDDGTLQRLYESSLCPQDTQTLIESTYAYWFLASPSFKKEKEAVLDKIFLERIRRNIEHLPRSKHTKEIDVLTLFMMHFDAHIPESTGGNNFYSLEQIFKALEQHPLYLHSENKEMYNVMVDNTPLNIHGYRLRDETSFDLQQNIEDDLIESINISKDKTVLAKGKANHALRVKMPRFLIINSRGNPLWYFERKAPKCQRLSSDIITLRINGKKYVYHVKMIDAFERFQTVFGGDYNGGIHLPSLLKISF